jgi:long-chain fatty acid transport protein
MAGAGAALPQDALAAATNPAGMVFVGNRMDVGAAIFSPVREYTVTGNPSGGAGTFPLEPGTVESDSNYFLVPSFGWNTMLDPNSSFGVAVYGNGGMNTDYPAHANPIRNAGGTCPSGTFCAGATGVDLMQLFIAPTYARKISESTAIGVAPILAYQRFEAKGLGAFAAFSSDPNNLTDEGTDDSTGFGARVGVQGDVGPGVTLAAAYQTKMSMSEFGKYKGLFAEEGDFDIPANWTVGIAWKTSPRSTLVFDVQKIQYSDIASIANPMLPNLTTAPLGDSDGAGFGWDDMTIYKLGYQWDAADMTWRVGYSTGDQPIPTSEVMFNILAPGVMEDHFTFGFTKALDQGMEFSFAAMYAPSSSVKGANPMEAPGQQTIELEMTQYEIEASLGWKF